MSLPSAEDLIRAATQAGLTVGVAESLTGGQLCACLVEVPGASAVVKGGIVAYDAALKVALLDVDADVLDQHGPVSEPVAIQMARGVREVAGADIGVSTTGAAGPEPHGGKKPGTVFVGLSIGDEHRAIELRIPGDRQAVRRAAIDAAISLVFQACAQRG